MIDVISTIRSAFAKGIPLSQCVKDLRQTYGGLSPAMIEHLKAVYGIDAMTLEPLIRWAPRLTHEPVAEHHLVVCEHCLTHQTDLKERLMTLENGEVITVTYGGCLGACDTGPNALLDGQLYTEIDHHEALWLKLQSLIEKKTAS